MIAIPDWLEESVGKAEEQHVEDRLLSEEVVDAQDLIFRQHLMELLVEGERRLEVVAKGLLDHHGGVLGQPRLPESLYDPSEEERWYLQIEQRPCSAVQPGGQPAYVPASVMSPCR